MSSLISLATGGAVSHLPVPVTTVEPVATGAALVNNLSQDQQNGGGVLGTLNAPELSVDFDAGPDVRVAAGSTPWAPHDLSTNYYETIPVTNRVVAANLTISRKTIAPDGVEVPGIVVNGQYPGPALVANWGDWFDITVRNDLDDEGTSLHWHGILQQNTSYEDGVPGVSQCPIPPGSSFRYLFRADLYGTSWYHSHYSAQYAAGATGPLIIHGPKSSLYDVDKGPVMLSDWYHRAGGYFELVEETLNRTCALPSTLPPESQNLLINGKSDYNCSNTNLTCHPNAGLSKFSLTSGQRYRFRVINGGAEAIQKFSIDGYSFTVIANDFVPVQPYTTDIITLGVGQRTDIVLDTANASPDDAIWMRTTATANCSIMDVERRDTLAAIYFENANTTAQPTTTSSITDDVLNDCGNIPLSSVTPAAVVHPSYNPVDVATQTLNLTLVNNCTDPANPDPNENAEWLWQMNGVSFRDDYNDPNLLEAKLANLGFPENQVVYNFGSNNSVRLVLYNTRGAVHPMHLHGHNMFVIEEGTGIYNGLSSQPANPQRRDVQLLRNGTVDNPSYLVIQWQQDNPGVWPFHCHIAWHVSMGLYLNLLERPADINSTQISPPDTSAQLCRDWWSWSGANVVDQIDSGL